MFNERKKLNKLRESKGREFFWSDVQQTTSCTTYRLPVRIFYDCIIVDCLCPINIFALQWFMDFIYFTTRRTQIFQSWNRLITFYYKNIFSTKYSTHQKKCNTKLSEPSRDEMFNFDNQKVLIPDQKLKANSLKLFFPIHNFSSYFFFRVETEQKKNWKL